MPNIWHSWHFRRCESPHRIDHFILSHISQSVYFIGRTRPLIIPFPNQRWVMSPEPPENGVETKPGPGRPRDPELEARRKAQILDVAARVFAAHGFANTQVQTIANHVGVGNGTVYRYFPTKDQLFLAAVERGLQELTTEMDRVLELPLDPLDALVTAIRTYLAFFHRRPEMAELFVQERAAFPHHHRPLYFATREDDERPASMPHSSTGSESGRVRPMPFERLFSVIGDLLFGTILTNLMSGRPADSSRKRDVADVILKGILTDGERTKQARETSRDESSDWISDRTRGSRCPRVLSQIAHLRE